MIRNLGSNEFWIVTIGRGLQVILAIVTLRILSSELPVTEVGYYYLIYTFVSWFGLVLVNPVGMFVNRMTNQWKMSASLSRASVGLLGYLIVVSLLAVAIVAPLNFYFDFSSGHLPYNLPFAVALQVLFTCLSQTLLSMLNLSTDRLTYIKTSLLAQTLALLLPLLMILEFQATAFNWLLGLAVANAIGAFIIFWQFLRAEQFRALPLNVAAIPLRQIITFGLPVCAATFLMWIQTQGYRIGIERWIGREALAELSIALGTALSLFAPLEAFMQQYLIPRLYRVMDESSHAEKSKAWTEVGGAALQFYATVFICYLLVAPHFLRILVAPNYQGLVFIFAMGLCIELFRVMTNLIYLATHSQWVPQASLLPYCAGIVTLALGGATLYPNGIPSLNSIAVVLALASCTSFVAMWVRVRGLVTIAWSWKLFFKTNWVLLPLIVFSVWKIDSIIYSFIATGMAGGLALIALFRLQKGIAHT